MRKCGTGGQPGWSTESEASADFGITERHAALRVVTGKRSTLGPEVVRLSCRERYRMERRFPELRVVLPNYIIIFRAQCASEQNKAENKSRKIPF